MLRSDRFFEKLPRSLDFAHGRVVFRAQAAMTFGEDVADDPQAMLDVIEGNQTVIEHEDRIVETDFIAQALGKALDEANHVVTEVADGAGDQWRQAGKPDRAKTLYALAQ